VHKQWEPVHVTLRGRWGLPSFPSELLSAAFADVIRRTNARYDDFRVTEFSVQDDHVHALVEVDDHEVLSRGMRSLMIRAALRFNRVLGRERGRLWGDRYHRRDLKTPRQVRTALVHVLAKYKKHHRVTDGRPRIDPCSSAVWFERWVAHRKLPDEPSPVVPARTRLLSSLWQKHGLIHPGEYLKLPG